MPIPSHEDAMLPVLRHLSDGKISHRREIAEFVANHFQLTPEERTSMLPSGKAPTILSRAGWALSYLKQAGLVHTPKRGWYQIAPAGLSVLEQAPTTIDNEFLTKFEAFNEFRRRTKETDAGGTGLGDSRGGDSSGNLTPDEALERAYTSLRNATEFELLDTVKQVAPSFFEELVIDLLVKMGYGGNRAEAARAIGRTGDGGIDGIIDEDRLGLDVIYVQAKRWATSVGRPEIQKFAGALQGQRATRGVFITTSAFTKDAEDYVRNINSRIVLVDGRRLASLMFEFDIGIAPRRTYVVKAIDTDYFEGADG
jgi:restriction system protein